MDQNRLLERFLRYVRVDTTARPGASEYPSSPGQLELGKLLVEELRQARIADARQDPHGIVTASIPASVDREVPVVAFCAHLDTSPETPGAGVLPQVVENYQGGELLLPGQAGRVIRPAEHPDLNHMIGKTIITSDGSTLLGADDKAGVAVIVEMAAWLAEHPEVQHGRIRICFTCDEEIGRGVDHVDAAELGAAACYTLDGQGADTIDVETFSADLAVVSILGVNIHPGIAKNCMVNAVRVAADFLARLPRREGSPEATDGRQGFLHPYEIHGGVAEAKLQILLRDFDTATLQRWADQLRQAAAGSMAEFPGSQVAVAVTPQYRNMAEGLAREPRAVPLAVQALKRLGRTPRLTIVRGGTDGSRLTEMGLPTPNLAVGQHAPHSPLEWASLEEMVQAARWLIELVRVWAQ